jgi:hypothetical protein
VTYLPETFQRVTVIVSMKSADDDSPRRNGDGDLTGYREIPCPSRYDGVGTALRRSFSAPAQSLPDQWQSLLDRLD